MKKLFRAILVPVLIFLILSVPLSAYYRKSLGSASNKTVPSGSSSVSGNTGDISDTSEDISDPIVPNSLPELTPSGTPAYSGPEAGPDSSAADVTSPAATLAPESPDTPTPTSTVTPVPTATNTPAPTATDTPAPAATDTPAPTATNTPAPSSTQAPLPDNGSASEVSKFDAVYAKTALLSGENAVKDAVNIIIGSLISDGMSDYEKIKVIHDYLVTTTDYDPDYRPGTNKDDPTYTEYGCLVNHCCVCQGYTDAFCILMDSIGIPCIEIVENKRVNGTVTDSPKHCWNAVSVDGCWYHIDITWDANDTAKQASSEFRWGISYRYFLLSDKYITLDHYIDLAYDINDRQVSIPVCGSFIYSDRLADTAFPGCIKVSDIEEAKIEIEKMLAAGETEITLFFTTDCLTQEMPADFKTYLSRLKSKYNRPNASFSKKNYRNCSVLKLKYSK